MTTNNQNRFSINDLNNQIIGNLPFFLNFFGIKYTEYKNRYAFTCPIHHSDKFESACIFKRGEVKDGNFVCWTQHCENDIGYCAYDLFRYLLKKKIT